MCHLVPQHWGREKEKRRLEWHLESTRQLNFMFLSWACSWARQLLQGHELMHCSVTLAACCSWWGSLSLALQQGICDHFSHLLVPLPTELGLMEASGGTWVRHLKLMEGSKFEVTLFSWHEVFEQLCFVQLHLLIQGTDFKPWISRMWHICMAIRESGGRSCSWHWGQKRGVELDREN